MINLKLNKSRLKTHWEYSKWFYLVFAIVFAVVFNSIYAIATPKTPDEYILEVFTISTAAADDEQKAEFKENILPLLSEEQVDVQISSLPLPSTDMNYYQIIMARFSAGEGDIIIIPKYDYLLYEEQGIFMSLEPYLDDYVLPEDYDMNELSVSTFYYDEENNLVDTGDAICAIPAYHLIGLADIGVVSAPPGEENENVSEMVICIPNYSDNVDNALIALEWMTHNMQEYEPAN